MAKAYRLLRSILNTAVDDGMIKRNPCRIKGADRVDTPERPFATVTQVYALAKLVPARYRVLILTAAFTGLRWSELVGLRRSDIDLDAATVRVPRRVAELDDGSMDEGSTKSSAGKRTVALPLLVMPELRRHLADFVAPEGDALVFTSPEGTGLRRGNFRRSAKWDENKRKAGLPEDFHFHDLRHTGNQLAAEAGASTKELMHRMGHSTVRAALVYQHATNKRDRYIAAEMSRQAKAALDKKKGGRRGKG
ncbi:tyrosine-type recombinase/integrase [Gandjariella thermophila]|uniref:Tyr recombinase domain-containing protein n=1 Tax=Gandjariella thermophila TaxID=1931992 RepID=A0A4D4JFP2_9PSEU|nr:site-specific integrase [Gandjariella thermophila]GDY33478.1 hypothetical protein GTS_51110 [Gandjariella thermophila]